MRQGNAYQNVSRQKVLRNRIPKTEQDVMASHLKPPKDFSHTAMVDEAEISAMARLLEKKYGSEAEDVAGFFARLHAFHNDAERELMWKQVAAMLALAHAQTQTHH